MNRLSCIAVDDHPNGLEVIRLHAGRVPFLELEETFRAPFEALDYVKRRSVDLVFLDIEMPDLSGMQLARMLPAGTLFVFTTAYSEYALESYDLGAVDYLHKPIEFERFLQAADKAATRHAPRAAASTTTGHAGRFLDFASGMKMYRVRLEEILFLEAQGNYVKFVCSERSFLVYTSLYRAAERLPAEGFLRIHRSYVVALARIDRADAHEVVIAGRRLPVGRKYAAEFSRRLGLGSP